MRSRPLLPALALLLAIPFARSAAAADYDVQPLGEKGNYIGCMAMNTTTGITFVAVAQSVSVMVTGKDFKVVKGDPVDGSWSIDGSKDKSLSPKADAQGTVSIDLDATPETLSMLAGGNELTATVGKTTLTFDMAGSKQALTDLGQCMDKIAKK